MTALDGMKEILDVNEMVEWLKQNNMSDNPKLEYCKMVDLLVNYRGLLADVMKNTNLMTSSMGGQEHDCL